ncbi:hypothetical protein F5050DRAFT_270887 [Lentinula boryana]|uniref:Uncharacterized protein n=1 Tax=Lentinula boryana TaxID=40481 RepID=A0ABQ8QAP6_9AGAR|nr:hypothetical protein F5050DRAFT_270887 [Lentinula boryana]
MFRTGSPYSQFFMSGLLPSAAASVNNANNEGQDGFLYEVDFRRRGSLPDTSSTTSVAQFHKERSFLSLDLAGAGSLRYARCIFCLIPMFSDNDHSAPSLHTLRSRPSLQSLPSQKPMPKYADALPALPALNATSRASSTLLPASHTNSVAGPSKPLVTSNITRNTSIKTTVSTVSTNYRRTKRSDALARLEGRSQAALASFKFGSIKEENISNFMSLSDDEDSSEDEWDMHSDEEADFVDLDIDFSSTHRHSYSTPLQNDDDEEDVLPLSPSRSHAYSRSFSYSTSSHSAPSRMQRHRSKTRSKSSYGFPSSTKSEPKVRSKTMSMFPSNAPPTEYTSFMDFEHSTHRGTSSSSSRRLSWSSPKDVTSPLPSPSLRKTDEWLQWSSFIEISAVV